MSTKLLTTSEAAAFAGVGQKLVGKWIDSGTLPGFKLPGGKQRPHRRTTAADLFAFLQRHGMPTPWKLMRLMRP